jgi:hypothetical protein
MRSFPRLQPVLLSSLKNDLKTIADDYVDKLRALYTQNPVDDIAFRVTGMSRKEVGSTADFVYLRYMVESYQRIPNQRDFTQDPPTILTYHPVELRYYISLTLRHLRDDGGTFDEVTYVVGYNQTRETELAQIQSYPNSFVLYDLWERTRADLPTTLFDSPMTDPNVIEDRQNDPIGDNEVKRPNHG